MKITLTILTLLMFFGANSFAQDYWHESDKNANTIRKGRITLSDGKLIKFKNLTIGDDVISYTDILGRPQKQQKSEVFKITKTGNYAGYGALLCGLSAFAGALQGLNEVNNVNNSLGVKDDTDHTGLVVGLTIGGAAFGALIGMMFKSEKTVYKNNAALSFYPSLNKTQTGVFCPMLSLKINLK